MKPKRNWVSNSKPKTGFEFILGNLWIFNIYFMLMSVIFILHLYHHTLPVVAYPIYLSDVLFSLTTNAVYLIRYAKKTKAKKEFNSNLEW